MKTPALRTARLVMAMSCLLASQPSLSFAHETEAERSDWAHAVASARQAFESFPQQDGTGERIDSDAFFEAEAECTAGAVALLSINDLLVAAPQSIQLVDNVLPDRNVIVYLRRGFSDGRAYDFICLISAAHALKKVRLVGGFTSSPQPAEMDGIHFEPDRTKR